MLWTAGHLLKMLGTHRRSHSGEGQASAIFFRKQALRAGIYPPLHKTMGVGPWMNATVGLSEARLAPWSTPPVETRASE